jgi:hypothetical protein
MRVHPRRKRGTASRSRDRAAEAAGSVIERLVASGRASAPIGDILTLLPPRGRTSTRTSEALAEDRADRL